MALSAKQKIFVNAYLATFNATEAARRAKYKGDDVTLASVGWENLRKPQIAEAISQRLSEKAMGPDEVLMRLGEQARSEHGKYISAGGAVDVAKLIEDGKGHLIKGVKETKFGRNIEFYDAQAALVAIGKHHKLFTEKVDINHSGSLEMTGDERAQAKKELDEWQQEKKKNAEISNG